MGSSSPTRKTRALDIDLLSCAKTGHNAAGGTLRDSARWWTQLLHVEYHLCSPGSSLYSCPMSSLPSFEARYCGLLSLCATISSPSDSRKGNSSPNRYSEPALRSDLTFGARIACL